jgi:hypothetical protein
MKYTFEMAASSKFIGTELCLHMDIVGVSFVLPACVGHGDSGIKA